MMSARSEAYGVSHLTPVLTNPQRQHSPSPELPISMATSHFDEIDLDWSPRERIIWSFMKPRATPAFTPTLLRELIGLRRMVEENLQEPVEAERGRYFVFGSRVPRIFNFGGDLRLFSEKIRNGDREGLRQYAYQCVEAVHSNLGEGLPIVSIALVQGDALGGGFEAALSFDIIIAERSAKFALPEILFNLFPGMGAYTLLTRRLDAMRAEKMILSGQTYSAQDLHEMGLVDVVAEDGEGVQAVERYIAATSRTYEARRALFAVRKRVAGPALRELQDVTDIWVDTAMRLREEDLRRMAHLMAAQKRRLRNQAAA